MPTARWIVPSIFSSKPTFFVKRLDPGVAADPELAEPPRALVRVERAEQELLPVGRRSPRRSGRCSNTSRTPGDLVAEVHRRELAEGDLALGRVLDRRVEDLAARHVDVPVLDRARAAPTSESVRSVRSPTIRTSLGRVEDRRRSRAIRLASASQSSSTAPKTNSSYSLERHPRLLRRGVRRVLADHPRHLHRHLTPAERLDPLLEEAAPLVGEVGAVARRSRARRSR